MDGFQMVSGKRCIKRRKQKDTLNLKQSLSLTDHSQTNKEDTKRDLSKSRELLEKSPYLNTLKDIMSLAGIMKKTTEFEASKPTNDAEGFDKCRCPSESVSPVQELVCYGIGRFGSDVIARYQLSLLLILMEQLQISSGSCHVYDPVLCTKEKEILSEFGIQVIPTNEECKRVTRGRTLFFMPHCGKALYNNLLWANWARDRLQNIVILGNSFSYMDLSTPRRLLEEEGSYILKILPHITEYPIPNTLAHTDIFNDLSLHLVTSDNTLNLSPSFWAERPEPLYDDSVSDVIFKTDSNFKT